MARGAPPVFLAHERYRQRRLRDALALMPVLGALLFALPLLWPRETDGALPGASNGGALIYLFGAWAGLIALGAGLSAMLRRDIDDDPDGKTAAGQENDAGLPAERDARPDPVDQPGHPEGRQTGAETVDEFGPEPDPDLDR